MSTPFTKAAFTLALVPLVGQGEGLAIIDTPRTGSENPSHQALLAEAEQNPGCQWTNHCERMHALATSVIDAKALS